MTNSVLKRILVSALVGMCTLVPNNPSLAFAFIFAGEANGLDLVTHPIGYSGTGGTVTVTIGIDPTSVNAASMVIPVQNVIARFNGLVPTTQNLLFNGNTNIPGGSVDFESVLLHEMGHSLGLAHVNAATESGLSGADQNYTKAERGADATFNLNSGTDGIIGSHDDVRGDDVNLHYFRISNNNPFTIPGTIDQSTYSRNLADLPSGHLFSANADRSASSGMGASNTEAVMQQGTYFNEAQRTLSPDDVAGLRYAQAGLDRIAGTADDYTLVLSYAGLTSSADIVIDFDNNQTGFAVSSSSGAFIGPGHVAITSNNIYFNDGYSWFFNDQTLPVEWVNFAADAAGEDVMLHWTTAAEINNDHFSIERSTDQRTWTSVGQVYPEYSSRYGQNYEFRDIQARDVAPTLYYRIQQVDMDGNRSYSDLREVQFEKSESSFVTMGPVPVVPRSFVQVDLVQMERVKLTVRDLNGREVWTMTRDGVAGTNTWPIGTELLRLPAGTYVLQIQGLTFHSHLTFTR